MNNQIEILGKPYKIVKEDVSRVISKDSILYVPIDNSQRAIKEYAKRVLFEYATPKVEYYDEKLTLMAQKKNFPRLTYNELKITNATRIFGRCFSTGKIELSYRLIFHFLPCIDLVIAHEVAHFAHMNHKKEFFFVLKWLLEEDHDYFNKILNEKDLEIKMKLETLK